MSGIQPTQTRWIGNWLIAVAGLTAATADQALFSYALSSIAQAFGVTLATMGAVVSASFACSVVGVVLCGIVTDRIGRRLAFTLMLVLSALCVGLHTVATAFWQLAALRILGFAISCGLYPVTSTLALESAPVRWRAVASGSLQIAYPIGFYLSSLVAAPLLEHGGWRTEFLFAFAVIPIALLLGWLLHEPATLRQARSPSSGFGEIGRLLRPPYRYTTLVCLTGSLLVSLAISGFIYFVPAFLVEARGVSQGDAARIAGLAFAIGGAGYVLSSLTGRFLLSLRNTLILWCLLGDAAFTLAVWGPTAPTGLILCFGLAVMFMFGSEAVRMPLVGERFPAAIRATGTALAGSAGVSLGSFISPLLITGLQPSLGWQPVFTLACILPLAMGALLFLALPNQVNIEP